MTPHRPIVGAALLLAIVTLICYWPVTTHSFINFDDPQYITKNPHVTNGLTWWGILWAFTTGYACNWHPLTWISHMLDCQLFGLNAGSHHFVNVLFHVANSVLLLMMLHRMTGAIWRSVFVAALFAWHPLHIESVAWASERKDVLSTLFWILTTMAYVEYVRKRSKSRYFLALGLFALGLMSKPMLVTLPCVLLLIDFWPLRRLRLSWNHTSAQSESSLPPEQADPLPARSALYLFCEKAPFFALALISSVITFWVQRKGGAVSSLENIPLGARVANAVVAYASYIWKTIWPVDLAPIYPYASHLPAYTVIIAAGLLLAASAWAISRLQRQPYLLTGWLWYLGTLVPTIGLVQVGAQSMADRYMYIPSIGLFIAIVWGLAAWTGSGYRAAVTSPQRQKWLSGLGVASLVGCMAATSFQVRIWRDAETLFRHTLEVSKDKYIAYNYLGKAIEDQGRTDEALAHYQQSIRLRPTYAEGNYNVGTILMRKGQLAQAMRHFETALKTKPSYPDAYNNLGSVYLRLGQLAAAKTNFSKAIYYNPSDPVAHYNLATVLLLESNWNEARTEFSEALRLNPNYAAAHANFGVVMASAGNREQAIYHFSQAVRLDPSNLDAQFNLGFALLEHGRTADAVRAFSEGLKRAPDSPKFHYHLALAMAREQNLTEATAHAEKARTLALAAGQADLAAKAQQLLEQK
jgi:protein O-mannosyl-transferase